MFSARLSQATSASRIRVTGGAARGGPPRDGEEGAALLGDREHVRRDGIVDSRLSAVQRRTWVQRVGGAVADTIDYKIVTVQVDARPMAGNVRKTTVIAPF